jgi:hypothetical protein
MSQLCCFPVTTEGKAKLTAQALTARGYSGIRANGRLGGTWMVTVSVHNEALGEIRSVLKDSELTGEPFLTTAA